MKNAFFSAAFLCFSLTFFGQTANADKTIPAWVNNPYEVCSEEQFCATGFGEGLSLARSDARAGIGKIFETKVRSSFSSSLSQENGEVKSSDRDVVFEESDVLLTAVEIKETYESPAGVYALAVLNKPLAASLLQDEISKLDEKMELLLSDKEPASVKKAERLYEKRQTLNQRYIILTGHPALEVVSYEDIFKAKKAAGTKRDIYLVFKGEQDPAVEDAVKSVFIDNGYALVQTPSEQARSVVFSMKSKKVPLSVDKFEKYIFYFSMTSAQNSKNQKEAQILSTSIEAIELSEEQALITALEEFEVYLQDHLDDFNF